MSMIGYILRVSPEQFRLLQAEPELIHVAINESTGCDDEDGDAGELGDIAPALDLQYWWHMLHYLLCGEAYQGIAPADTLLSGDEFGPDLGYGPVRYVTPSETADFSKFLSNADFDGLFSRIDLDRAIALGVYPINKGNKDEMWSDDLRPQFTALCDYMAEAANSGDGYLFWIV